MHMPVSIFAEREQLNIFNIHVFYINFYPGNFVKLALQRIWFWYSYVLFDNTQSFPTNALRQAC